jgi:hypothetical protein
MPITKSGKKVLRKMQQQYGMEKGEKVFFGSIVRGKKGSEKWHGKGSGKLAKAKRTYAKKRGKKKKK